ncbi:hypothetical protein ASZ78_001254 [Callipepla squamata]|uniref:Ceramide-1-phosphate transfer protein n=1 Tax=Callipepla squamata TaxID=9009 RepID=A0A226N168_CALSU|nr:hypothetical protein ASZ78_001254 [Callipepla squamata]
MAAEPGAFSLREVLAAFEACVTEQREDAVAKIQIMESYCGGERRDEYRTLQSMVRYELSGGLLGPRGRPDSGCRTVLRLHRALRWLQLFLEGLRTAPRDASTSAVCTDSYNASLAAYHPWIVRKAATVAFRALPSRDAFLGVMNVGGPEEAVEMLGEALPHIREVYGITQELYEHNRLLDLP